ncbi:MAG TPA: ethylbenzene dehydrogenase-related protein [Tepidiformaceae bacterium]|jgi:DMSO reductase family type II enzyme heme b subunit
MTLQKRTTIDAAVLGERDGLGSAAGPAWDGVPELAVDLVPTDLGAQPSVYVQKAWENHSYGAGRPVLVQAAVTGNNLFVRLRWAADDPRPSITDNNVFPDACGVLFPLDGNKAELKTMGSDDWPVQAWHWRAGTADPFVVVARGLGTAERQTGHSVTADASHNGDEWRVVFSRALNAKGVPLARGAAVPVGFAVWAGANNERAGLKAHSPEWIELRIP